MLHKFKYYLHDDYDRYETAEFIQNQIPTLSDVDEDALVELIGRPFYEVTLNCTFDDSTGEVNVVSVKL